jgi:hypothetical protein
MRLLEARLEVLARACERSPASERRFDRLIVATAAATRHAVALELITTEEASAVWAGVSRRHPGASWCQVGPGIAA